MSDASSVRGPAPSFQPIAQALSAFSFPATVGVTDAHRTLAVLDSDGGASVPSAGGGGAPGRRAADPVRPLASVSKPIAALAALVAVGRGLVDLDDPAGPEGSTVKHLLCHAAGYAFDSDDLLADPGKRRIYSNTGFDVLAEHVAEATGYDFPDWVEETVVGPLGTADLEVDGRASAGYRGTVEDLLAIGREWLEPSLVPSDLHADATSVQFSGLDGILPGYGRQRPNDWGLGVEIRDGKSPHWTGASSAPETFGHFGQSGSFLWVDPTRGLAAAFLGHEPFGAEHIERWPALTDAILETVG